MKDSKYQKSHFILNMDELNHMRSPMRGSNLSNFTKTRPKIFGNNNSSLSRQSQQSPDPSEPN